MVIEPQADKSFNAEYEHDNIKYNLEMKIELQGEKTDQRTILR